MAAARMAAARWPEFARELNTARFRALPREKLSRCTDSNLDYGVPSAARSLAAGNLNFSVVFPNPFESDLDVPVAHKTRKLLSPLYQENAVFGEQVVESKGFQLPWRVNTIQVNVIQSRSRSAIFVHQRKGGAGDIFFRGSLKSCGNPLDKRGLACAQVAAQQHQLWRREQFGQRSPEGGRLLRRMSNRFARAGSWCRHTTSIARACSEMRSCRQPQA